MIQKYIINKAKKASKEAFIATNTLEKMSYSLKPDRSEVNDVINIILDGATGIALTKETAIGKYPLETVNMLNLLIKYILVILMMVLLVGKLCSAHKEKTVFFKI